MYVNIQYMDPMGHDVTATNQISIFFRGVLKSLDLATFHDNVTHDGPHHQNAGSSIWVILLQMAQDFR